jgi:hypothetical protein
VIRAHKMSLSDYRSLAEGWSGRATVCLRVYRVRDCEPFPAQITQNTW